MPEAPALSDVPAVTLPNGAVRYILPQRTQRRWQSDDCCMRRLRHRHRPDFAVRPDVGAAHA